MDTQTKTMAGATPRRRPSNPFPSLLLRGAGWLALGWLLGACSIPLPPPKSVQSAAIGVSIQERWNKMAWFDQSLGMGYFIRLNDAGLVTAPLEILRSNYFRGNRFYLLNAKPGRYALVAASEFARLTPPGGASRLRAVVMAPTGAWRGRKFRGEGALGLGGRTPASPAWSFTQPIMAWVRGWTSGLQTRSRGREESRRFPLRVAMSRSRDEGENVDYFVYTTYFPQELIQQTTVEAAPGRMVVMGALQVVRHRDMHKADPAQQYYHRSIDTLFVHPNGMPIFNSHPDAATASRGVLKSVRKGPGVTRAFLSGALEDFKGSAWEAVVRRSLTTAPLKNADH